MNRFFAVCMALLLAVGLALSAQAAIQPFKFQNPADEQRFDRLSNELRCLVCQNENLADSNAELAQDLRRQIYQMIESGSSDQQIVKFMVDRYGDFVLYRPPLKSSTYLLWFGPFVFAIIGLILLLRFIRRSERAAPELSPEEQERLQKLLKDG